MPWFVPPADTVPILKEAEEGCTLRGIMDFLIAELLFLAFKIFATSGWAFSYPTGRNNLQFVLYQIM